MKKFLLLSAASVFMMVTFAQSEKFIKAMEPKVIAIDTTSNVDELLNLANAFERIADAEKNQWTPYYYAALAHVNAGLMMAVLNGNSGGIAEKTDPEANKAEQLLNKAEELSKENSEIWIVRKQIATLRLMADPMNRYMTYGPAASEALATAKKLNPDNPRVYLLEGQDKYFTPEQFGGSKTEAQKLFAEASKKFESFKPESSVHPVWGLNQLKYFQSLGGK
ncbi:MAG: hypothetical protein ACSLE0_21975 [Chitinophagaceae bacterium]